MTAVGAREIPGLPVGVKTGTAETVIDGAGPRVDHRGHYHGRARAQVVLLYNPKVASVSSDSSAPLFGDIARTAVANLGIPRLRGQLTCNPRPCV